MTEQYITTLLKIAKELETIIKDKNMFSGTEINYQPEYDAKVNQLLGYIMALEQSNP